MANNRVFISYSHKDKEFLDRLNVHLKPLERDKIVDIWADTKILLATNGKKRLKKP